jgi:hypothetical protein
MMMLLAMCNGELVPSHPGFHPCCREKLHLPSRAREERKTRRPDAVHCATAAVTMISPREQPERLQDVLFTARRNFTAIVGLEVLVASPVANVQDDAPDEGLW